MATQGQTPLNVSGTITSTSLGAQAQNNEIRTTSQPDERANDADVTNEILAAQTRLMTLLTKQLQPQPLHSFQVMPDLTKSITCYDGEHYGHPAREWIDKVQCSSILHHWPDATTLETARMHLTGAAKAWYEARMSEITTWDEFNYAFRRTFDRKESTTLIWETMRSRKQLSKEGMSTYFHEKYKLCARLNLDFEEIKEQSVAGLTAVDIKCALMTAVHLNADDLLHDILRLDRVRGNETTRKVSGQVPSTSVPETNVTECNDAKMHPRRAAKPWNEKGEPKCFNCNLYGHLSRECSRPRKNGRDKTEARHTRNVVNTIEPGHQNDGIGKYVREITINGRHIITGLIDSGSAVCTVKKVAITRFGLLETPAKRELFAFGDVKKPAIRCNTVVHVTITIDNVSVDKLELWVVPNDAQATDMIVGRTFTDQPHVAYVKVGGKLHFGHRDTEPFKDLTLPETTRRVTLRAAEQTELLSNSVTFVKVRAGDEQFSVPIENDSRASYVLQESEAIGFVRPKFRNVQYTGTWDRLIVREDVNVDASVGDKETRGLLTLLNNYRNSFATCQKELGCTDVIQMDIEDDNVPVQCKPYRQSAREREVTRNIVREWKEQGIVRETNSPYASPVMLVTKKSGEPRLVIDYRKLNAQTTTKPYPMPNSDEAFEGITGCTVFTVLDLASGYLQVPLTEDAKRKTAFITCDERGEFQRMVFGLKNAPFVFTQLMQRVLGPLRGTAVVWYMDDILIPGRDWGDMCGRLTEVLKAIADAKLTLNLTKCEFGKREVEFLGFVLSEGKVRPGLRKTLAVRDYPSPKNVHEVRRFLGLMGYFRKFVSKYAERARPLTDLTKTGVIFTWDDAQRNAFHELKEALTSQPVLQLYNPNAETELHCDASCEGLAGMLLQRGADGKMHAVYYLSKKTTNEERNYHSSKLELMTIVFCVGRLRQYLIGIHFIVVTDCQALTYLNAQRTINPQIARWYHLLQEYDLEIRHRPGVKMALTYHKHLLRDLRSTGATTTQDGRIVSECLGEGEVDYTTTAVDEHQYDSTSS